MATAPRDGTQVLLVFADGAVSSAEHDGHTGDDHHNGWWSGGLDFGYGQSDPVGWLPRSTLPDPPPAEREKREGKRK